MNKIYYIIPVVLLGAFLFVYRDATREMDKKEKARQEQIAAAKAVEEAHRKELDQKAEEEAKARQEQRDRELMEKEAKARKDYEDVMNSLKKETAEYNSDAEKYAKESAALEKKLSDMRSMREKLNKDNFDLTRQVELARISRRNAELEIQRTYEIVAKRFADSNWGNPPPPPPPAKR